MLIYSFYLLLFFNFYLFPFVYLLSFFFDFFWPALRVGVVGFARPGFRAGWPTPGGVLGGRGGPGTPPGGVPPENTPPPIFGGWGGDAPPCHVGALAIFSRFLQKSIY